jgi:ABC-type branched-subunit amino acid transport system permease subunit
VRQRIPSLALVALVLAGAVLAPEPIVLGALRLTALATAVTGATLLISRVGAADLAVGPAVAAGAYAGGVATALLGWPVLVGLPLGAAAGAGIGAASGALHGRLGRLLGALTSLTLGGGLVAVLAAWPEGGGVAGFHAVGLPTPGGDRADLAVVGLVLLGALAVHDLLGGGRAAAAASVAVRAPVVAAALGRHPARDAARIGAAGGALLGLGGVSLAAVDGSVMPAAYGLELTAALALAALLGGASLPGPVLGTLVVWGPGTVWPLVPLVGTAPPLLVVGPLGLALLALRRGRPLLPTPAPRSSPAGTPAPRSSSAAASRRTAAASPPAPSPPARRRALVARGLETPAGRLDLHLEPGEVVALLGPNGAGKSTVLARLGGQLPDGGRVELGDGPAPRGAVARARVGIGRTWQRPPDVPAGDVERLLLDDPDARRAASWARHVLGGADPDPTLRWLAARGPAVALLDEPTDVPADRLVGYLRGLADAGTAVLVVDHRPEVAAAADRVVTIGAEAVAT